MLGFLGSTNPILKINHYTIEAAIGSESQRIQFQIDTGSSDTWVNWVESDFCQKSANTCSEYGAFDFTASKTKMFALDAEQNPANFGIMYKDNAAALGKFIKDTFVVGGRLVENVQFGLATISNVKTPVLGLGLEDNEYAVLSRKGEAYPNLVPTLVNNGLIKAATYSLWLNKLSAHSGILLFGGIDQAKYSGKLETFEIQTAGPYKDFTISLDAISLTNSQISTQGFPVFAILDVGTTNTFLPLPIVGAIWETLNVVTIGPDGTPYVRCELAKSSSTLTFTFGAKLIEVPISQLVYNNPYVEPIMSDSGVTLCTLGIFPTEKAQDPVVLGVTFLRSVYVVFDLHNRKVSLAQAAYSSSSDIQELGPGGVEEFLQSKVHSSQNLNEEENRRTKGSINNNQEEEPTFISKAADTNEKFDTLGEDSITQTQFPDKFNFDDFEVDAENLASLSRFDQSGTSPLGAKAENRPS